MKVLANTTLAALWGLIMTWQNSALAAEPVYWRFENGQAGQPVQSTVDESGCIEAVSSNGGLIFSTDVAMAIVPLSTQANQFSAACSGGYLKAKSSPELNVARNFTVELWAKFGTPGSSGSVLLAKGSPGEGNWHIIYQTDGTVQANIFGGSVAYLFDLESGGPVPGIWYHLAAIFEDRPNGKTRIRTFVNGHVRGGAAGALLGDTGGTDLFIGSFIDGKYPFDGMLDEVRITPSILDPKSFLLAGTRPIPEMAAVPEPLFVPAGTRIDADLRAKAAGAPILLEPSGYTYFYTGAGLKKQDEKSKYPGSFIGGDPLRTGFIWGQGTIFSGLMAYHELSGDQRALEAAGKLADWYESYLNSEDLAAANYFIEPKNEFSRTGATVGQLGEGALEPMLWLYWHTKDPKYLERAKKIAELRRKDGGVAWMIHGDIADLHPEYDSWHLHANLSTVRGFPCLVLLWMVGRQGALRNRPAPLRHFAHRVLR